MRVFSAAILVAACVVVAALPARAAAPSAGCTSAPASQWLSMDQIKSRVEAQGYVVGDERIENGCAEIAAYRTHTGALDRLRVDPSTGRIVEIR